MNIVLLGYRGTGKSVIGKLLSRKLKRALFSIDAMIVREAGLSIPEIVAGQGWQKFRELEAETVERVSRTAENSVIDCGGGVVLDDRNVEHLKRNGRAVLLTADFDTLIKRIGKDANRPPLKEGLTFEEEQSKVLSEREPKYRAAADFVCDTTRTQAHETVRQIIDHFKKMKWI